MKKILTVLLALCASNAILAQGDSMVVATSDITHFWQAFDQLSNQHSTADSLSVIDHIYIQPASAGLQQYMKAANCYAPQYLDVIRSRSKDYLAIRSQTLTVMTQKPRLLVLLREFRERYPAFRMPAIYFAIGKFEVGGTAFGNIEYVGVETVFQNKIDIVPLTIHEIAHSQQQDTSRTNLAFALLEGGAEFVAWKITGGRTIADAWDYGMQHEHELWQEFKVGLDSPFDRRWFLASPDTTNHRHRPGSLGYFIGFRICEAYLKSQADKSRAFQTIVAMKEPAEIWKLSDYHP